MTKSKLPLVVMFGVSLVLTSCGEAADGNGDTGGNGALGAAPPAAAPAPGPQSTPAGGSHPFPPPYTHPGDETTFVPNGEYGGQEVLVTVSEHGAQIKFACARGDISQPVALDRDGNFSMSGTYQSRSGSVPPGGYPVLAAHYSGYAVSGHLHFDVSASDGHGSGGSFDRKYDTAFQSPPVFKEVCAVASPGPGGSPTPTPAPTPMPHP